MRVRRKRNRAATPRYEKQHPLVNPLFAPLCNTKDLTIKGRFYDILDEERALDNPDERAFYRTALEYRQRLFSRASRKSLCRLPVRSSGLRCNDRREFSVK